MTEKTGYVEIEYTLSCKPVKTDLGVPRSPVFTDYTDVRIETVSMFGREWTINELDAEFGNLADWIMDNDNGEW